MMLRFSFGLGAAADAIENAARQVIANGLRTADIFSPGMTRVNTSEMGDAIVEQLTLRSVIG